MPRNAPKPESCFSTHGWKKYHRELLPQQKRGDPYQYLKVDLEGLYE
jgi:hypothetical protein